jgi:hypothetical protein
MGKGGLEFFGRELVRKIPDEERHGLVVTCDVKWWPKGRWDGKRRVWKWLSDREEWRRVKEKRGELFVWEERVCLRG